jgi:hypothetical protein
MWSNKKVQEKKKECFKIRVTTFIQGELKNNFMNECLSKEITEAELARDIFYKYFKNKEPYKPTKLTNYLSKNKL